jgi:4-amino-4-deoxy-L-arabinose transferase-like glycosyltransferase
MFKIKPSQFITLSGLVLLIYVMFFYQLGGIGLVGPDEPRYAQIAREMVESGDYITPRLMGHPWFEKPVLYYWGTSLAYQIFGVNEASARLTSACAAVWGLVCIFWLARKWISPRGGWIACAILSSSILYFSLARAASMDMLLTGCLTGAWSCLGLMLIPGDFHSSSAETSLARVKQFGFFVFLALSVLAKGPVGIVLIGGCLSIYLLITQDWRALHPLPVFRGGVLFLLIAVPWYWLCYRANGFVFIEQFFIQHNLQRFSTDRYQHTQPSWFYWAVLGVGFFPWILQLPAVLGRVVARLKSTDRQLRHQELFLLFWVLLPLLFFSVSHSKLPGYILPVIPPLSFWVAREFSVPPEEKAGSRRMTDSTTGLFRFGMLLQSGSLIILGVVLPFGVDLLNLNLRPFVPVLTILLLGVGALSGWFGWRCRSTSFLIAQLAGIALTVGYLCGAAFPQVDAQESQRDFSLFLKNEVHWVNQPLYLFYLPRKVEYGLDYYLNQKTRVLYSLDSLQVGKGENALLILSSTSQVVFPASIKVLGIYICGDKKILRITTP